MLKKFVKIMLSLVMVLSLVLTGISKTRAATPQQDMVTIKTRLKEYFLELDTIDDGAKVETCTVSNAKSYLDMIQDDGSFDDVDYDATNSAANGGAWSPYLALDRLQAIAIAYHKAGNDLYQKQEVVDKLNQAIIHWGKEDPRATNWWENQVGVQLRFSRIALFMDGIISEEAKNIIMTKLLEKKPVKYGTGQNNLWFDQNYIYHALISEDETQLTDMIDNYLSYCLVIQEDDNTAEAVQVDNSFYMHGRQFYSNGYGMSMFRDMSFWIYMLRETQFALSDEVVDLMANYMINGTSWTIRGDLLELYLGYRPYKYEVGYKNYAAEYIAPLQRMIASDPKRASQYQSILDNIEDVNVSNGKNGNYYMWRSGYAGHMRNNYGVNIKMDSKNIIGGEWRGSWPAGQDGGQLIYWTSSAASTISVDGDEYINVYPTFDWAHCPGTTTASRVVQDYGNYGRFTNGTDHTIGLTNGKYGNTAYVMNKKDTQATKGYFFFDDEFVALGAGINSKEKVNIHTTLNQSEANQVTVDGQNVAEGTKAQSYTTKWLHNDKIGYVFLKDTNVVVSNTKQADNPSLWSEDKKQETPATFTAWLDHGLNPNNAEYAYIVVPGKTATEVQTYANTIPVTVVSNTKDVQAVRHDGLKQTQINFYKAGSLKYKNDYTITVDQPCNVLIDESGDARKITVAVSDVSANQNINVTLTNGNVETVTRFVSGQLPYAGESMTLVEGTDDRYQASSSTSGHSITMAVDGDVNTYWESVSQTNEWASFYTGNQKHLSNVEILWGSEYATDYEVYTSQNGKDYQLLREVTSTGEKDTIELNGVYPYIKIVMKDGNGTHYQIKEVSFKASDSLALNKPVEVSSTSTNDPGNKAPLAVDGNKGTRWSSLRKEDDNWIIIDLEKFSRIDAINILWEAACSDNYNIEVSSDKKTWSKIKEGVKTSSNLKDEYNFKEPVYGRYVKIHSLKSSKFEFGISIYEIDIYGAHTKEDIALNKNVFAKTIDNLNLPTNVNDSKLNTKWMSTSKDEWIYVELKGKYSLSDMSITWGNNYATSYDVEVSSDAKNWNRVKSISGTGGTESINDLNNVEAKYVRLKLTASSGDVYEIMDWKIYGDLIEIDNFENVALNKEATASSIYKSQYDASKAFDGSFDGTSGKESRWVSLRQKDSSEDRSQQWITVDLQAYYELSGVKLYWEGAGAKQYKLLVSNDGKNWREVYVENAGQPGIADIQLNDNVEARYVKMEGTEPASIYGYSIWEFEVYGEKVRELGSDSTVISLNKPVKVSSISTNDPTMTGDKAVDGNTTTRWGSLRKQDDNWIIVDLEKYSRIDKINIDWEAACSNDYTIEVSNDNATWELVTEAKSNVVVDKHAIDEHVYEEPIYGRYVKIHSYKSRSFDYGVNIFEISIWGDEAEEPTQPTGVNIALNKPSKASSEYTNPKTKFVLESNYAFDGSVENRGDEYQSRWVSLRRKENTDKDIDYQWIYVDLQHTYDIDKVVLNWEGACATEYKIQVSNNGRNWVDIEHVTNGKSGVREFSFSDIQGRYVRVECLRPAGDYGYSLWEFEVYGQRIKTPVATNLALNKPSQASSEFIDSKDGNKQYFSSLAFDGNTNKIDGKQSRWTSHRNTNDEWIYVDLEDSYNISKIVLNWEGKGAKEYKLQTSLDGSEWVDITHATDKKGGIDTYDYTDAIGRYVRMQGIEVGDVYGYSLWEFEVYGEKVDSVELKVLYNLYKYLDVVDCTPATIEKFTTALENARIALANADADTLTLATAIQNLQITVDGLQKMADFSVLNGLITEVEKLDETKYTPNSWTQLQPVLVKAKEVANDKNSTQEVIDENYNALKNVYDALVKIANKEDLGKLLDSIKDIDRDLYVESSLVLLDSTVANAQGVYDDKNIDQTTVQNTYNELDKVVKQMLTKEMFNTLEEAIEKAEAIHKDEYTQETVTILEAMLKEANDVIGKETPLADEVSASLTKLTNAFNGLVKKVDKSKLIELVDKVEKLDLNVYTPSSVDKLKLVLSEARIILDQDRFSQKDVDNVIQSLKEAMSALVEKANKDDLIDIIDKAETIDRDIYTQESLNKLDEILVSANKIVEDDNASQEAVDKALKDVKEAYEGLTKKVIIDIDDEGSENQKPSPSQPDDTTYTDNSSDHVKTNDDSMTLASLMIAILSMLGIFFTTKKSKKSNI